MHACSRYTYEYDLRSVPRLPTIAPRVHADEAPRPAAAPSKLRKVGSEGKLVLAVPKDVEEFRTMSAPYGHLSLFSYDELRKATGDFNPGQIVGEGGFGVVYRGLIDGAVRKGYPPTTEVAVKVLNPEGIQGDKEWLVRAASYRSLYMHARTHAYLHEPSPPTSVVHG
jgi:hypothetical protein